MTEENKEIRISYALLLWTGVFALAVAIAVLAFSPSKNSQSKNDQSKNDQSKNGNTEESEVKSNLKSFKTKKRNIAPKMKLADKIHKKRNKEIDPTDKKASKENREKKAGIIAPKEEKNKVEEIKYLRKSELAKHSHLCLYAQRRSDFDFLQSNGLDFDENVKFAGTMLQGIKEMEERKYRIPRKNPFFAKSISKSMIKCSGEIISKKDKKNYLLHFTYKKKSNEEDKYTLVNFASEQIVKIVKKEITKKDKKITKKNAKKPLKSSTKTLQATAKIVEPNKKIQIKKDKTKPKIQNKKTKKQKVADNKNVQKKTETKKPQKKNTKVDKTTNETKNKPKKITEKITEKITKKTTEKKLTSSNYLPLTFVKASNELTPRAENRIRIMSRVLRSSPSKNILVIAFGETGLARRRLSTIVTEFDANKVKPEQVFEQVGDKGEFKFDDPEDGKSHGAVLTLLN